MEPEMYKHIRANKQMLNFLRRNPIWYRRLSHHDHSFEQFEKEVRIFYGQTVPQRIEKVKNQLTMIDMIISLSKAMKD